MRIAQVAPLFESVPPKLYGGTERVVSHLTEELVRLGHEVSLFASGDSITRAHLVPICPSGLRLDENCRDSLAWHLVMLERVAAQAASFDIIHFHTGIAHFPLARRLSTPHVTTLHGTLELAELDTLFREFSELPMISISDAQRTPIGDARWIATVPHGLPDDLLAFNPRHRGYLAFLGRISPEKRVDRAIAIAEGVGWPLRIAAKIDPADTAYFESEIRPLLANPLVTFLGEIGDAEKSAFLGGAKALLFPIDWREPFGLVMIEALACGTPVVAFRGGSVPEVIDQGDTGFIVDSVEEAIAATRRIESIDRRMCRRVFERRFTTQQMADAYLAAYQDVIDAKRAHAAA